MDLTLLAQLTVSGIVVGSTYALLGVSFGVIYATTKHWQISIPATAWAGGLAATLVIGAVAGLLPAVRAARLSPTEALRTV